MTGGTPDENPSALAERRSRRILLTPLQPVRKNPLDELRLLDTRDHIESPAAAQARASEAAEIDLAAPE